MYLRRIGRLERRIRHYREHRLAVHPAALHSLAHPVVLEPQRPQRQQPPPKRASAVPAQPDPATHFHDTCAVDGLHGTGRSERGCVDGVEERVLGALSFQELFGRRCYGSKVRGQQVKELDLLHGRC